MQQVFKLLHKKMDDIYEDDICCEHAELAAKKDKYKKITTAFDTAVDHIHKSRGFNVIELNSEPVKNLTAATFNILKDAINTGITHQVPKAMRIALETNVYIFSGIKSYVSLKEAAGLMFDDKGDIKPLPAFKQDVKAINATYNENYIEAEYRFTIQASQGADNWQQYVSDGDRYNLQYRTAGDSKVRPEHAALANITLPITDPFWDKYFTPNGWRCRCKVVQVRKGKYEVSDSDTAMAAGEKATTKIDKDGKNSAAMFRFNPGKEQKVFPDNHPYNKVAPAKAKEIIKKQANDK